MWKETLGKGDCDQTFRLNFGQGSSADLPHLPYSLHLFHHIVHRFFARVKPILIVRIHEALCDVQDLIDIIQLALLMGRFEKTCEG